DHLYGWPAMSIVADFISPPLDGESGASGRARCADKVEPRAKHRIRGHHHVQPLHARGGEFGLAPAVCVGAPLRTRSLVAKPRSPVKTFRHPGPCARDPANNERWRQW